MRNTPLPPQSIIDLPDLGEKKDTDCPVKLEFQINDEWDSLTLKRYSFICN